MDEDTQGLKTLIKQRNLRPCYARTISLEFSRTEHSNPAPTQRRRRHSKKNARKKSSEINDQSGGSENELEDILSTCDLESECKDDFEGQHPESSSESEYYSADESLSSESISEGSLSQIADNLSELDFLLYSDSENNGSDSDSDSAFYSVSSSGSIQAKEKPRDRQLSQSQRAPSKKQKRKRRREGKVTFLNSLPFSGLDNFECSLSDVKSEITESADQLSVNKSVPSLSDLCLLASRNIGMKNASANVPYKIRQLFKESGVKKNLQKFQLSWLYRLLTFVEQGDEFERNCLYTKSSDDKECESKVLIPRRNIWDDKINCSPIFITDNYNGCLPTSYIPYTHCSHYRHITQYNEYNWDWFFVSRNCLSAYATTVDLMMPPVIKMPRQRKKRPSGKTQQQGDDETAQIIKNLTLRLQAVLKQRFPKSSKYYFNLVLPYVFWARGDLVYAASAFTELAEKESRSRMKAMYLYEIGRMYSQFDEAERAKSCYKLAADAAMSKAKHSDEEVINEINRQTLMLTANAYDQGLMTTEKATTAFDFWKAGVTYPKKDSLHCYGLWSYMDSLLCYHAWSLENGSTSFLEEAKTRITSLTKSFAELYYYLSMVYALEGNAQECAEAYRCFKYGGGMTDSAPGMDMMGLMPRTTKFRSPWNILIDMVRKSDTVKPLQVVWRTQLEPLTVIDKTESWDSDMHSKDINLRLSSEGYVTGDMQMALPPLRGIYLDPYTGYLCFPHLPGDTETWIGLQTDLLCEHNQFPDKSNESNLVVPTPTELYRDESGNVVHLMCPSMFQAMIYRSVKVQSQHMVLTWTGCDGQKARYNLLSKLHQMAYEDFIRSLPDESIKYSKNIPNWIEIMTKLAQYCLSKGMDINKITLRSYVTSHWGRKSGKSHATHKPKTKSKQTKKTKPADKVKSFVGQPCTLLLGQPVVFNTNLCIPVNLNANMYLVYIDCRNKTDFLNPVILHRDAALLCPTFNSQFQEVLKGYRLPHADVMYWEMKNGDYIVYDNFGEQVDRILRESIQAEDGTTNLPVIVNRNKICFLDNKSLRSFQNEEEEWAAHLGQINQMKNIHNVLVLLTTTGVKFADGRSFLPLLVFSDDGRSSSLQISDDSMEILGEFKYFSILHEEILTNYAGNEKYTRAVLALDNHLVILKLPEEEDIESVTVLLSITLPGHAKEICFIGGSGGFLVTVTQHLTSTSHYRENLYYFDVNGRLKNYLLCLGHGPRSFLPVYLTGNPELQETQAKFGREGWHVYMRDGHDGIICVYLHP